MSSLVYALIHEENGAYGISFPDFPGCVSGGRSLDEALARGAGDADVPCRRDGRGRRSAPGPAYARATRGRTPPSSRTSKARSLRSFRSSFRARRFASTSRSTSISSTPSTVRRARPASRARLSSPRRRARGSGRRLTSRRFLREGGVEHLLLGQFVPREVGDDAAVRGRHRRGRSSSARPSRSCTR